MHYERLQIADTSFNTHEQLKIFQQPDSQLSMQTVITHSGKHHKMHRRTFKQEHRFKKLKCSHSQ